MPNGDATTDTALVQGQVGYQYPVGCKGTLCSYPYGYTANTLRPFTSETTHYNLLKNIVVPGAQSWTFSGIVPDAPYLERVSAVSAPAGTSLQLYFYDTTWDETSISVERRLNTSATWTTIATWGTLNQGNDVGYWSWINSGLSRTTTYCYRMLAKNAFGPSTYSSERCATTL